MGGLRSLIVVYRGHLRLVEVEEASACYLAVGYCVDLGGGIKIHLVLDNFRWIGRWDLCGFRQS